MQSGFTNGESTSFLPKPAKIVGRVSPILSTATRIANNVKVEKDSHLHTPKTLTGNLNFLLIFILSIHAKCV